MLRKLIVSIRSRAEYAIETWSPNKKSTKVSLREPKKQQLNWHPAYLSQLSYKLSLNTLKPEKLENRRERGDF